MAALQDILVPDIGDFKNVEIIEVSVKLIFDSWGRVAARKLLILLVWGADFSNM